VEGIRRGTRRTAALGAAAAGVTVLLAPLSAHAQVQPDLGKLGFKGPAIVGKDSELDAVATDKTAPVSGVVVSFGSRREVFGISACQPVDSAGVLPGGHFRPGTRTSFKIPHRFRKKGKHRIVVRFQSGGCLLPLSEALAQFTVSPSSDGKGPPPSEPKLIPTSPAGLLPPASPPGPLLVPVAGSFARFARREAVAHAARRGCRYAHSHIGRSRKSLARARKATLCLLNAQRRRYHLPRLRSNRRLLKAAEAHSRSMIRLGYFSHYEPGGIALLARILRTGYLGRTRGWSIGENLGMGRGPGATPSAMTRAWMASPPHRENILAGKFREIGLGILAGMPGNSRTGATYTTDFGRRR
jgi:uncharacterized protein YkwD